MGEVSRWEQDWSDASTDVDAHMKKFRVRHSRLYCYFMIMEMHEEHHAMEIRDGGARAEVLRPAPGVVLVRVQGHQSPAITDGILQSLERLLRDTTRPMHIFVDHELTTSIGPGTVAKWSAFLRRNASRVAEMVQYVPTHDRIVVAASIINRLTGGMVQVVRARDDFERRMNHVSRSKGKSAIYLAVL
jgi:hypothetical protein